MSKKPSFSKSRRNCLGFFCMALFLFTWIPTTVAGIWTEYSFVQNAVCLAPQGEAVWIGSTTGAWKLNQDGTFVQYTQQQGLVGSLVMDMAIDSSGNLWLATMNGISRFNGSSWLNFSTEDGLISNQVRAIAIDPLTDDVWLGTSQGACRYDGSNWTGYTQLDGLVDNQINTLAIDSGGSVWFGTSQGVSRFNGRRWTTYTQSTGLADNQVNAICIDTVGGIWFGTADGAGYYNGSSWQTYRTIDGLAANLVNDIAVDTDGNVWFGCYGGGVSLFDGQTWTRYTRTNGLISNQVTAVAVDSRGHQWIATSSGVSEFDSHSSLLTGTGTSATGGISGEDRNNDGVSDSNQENVTALLLPDGQYLTVVSEPGTRIADLSIENIPTRAQVPTSLDFPYGLIDFTIDAVGAGKSTVVTLFFPDDATPQTYYKYGPTPEQPQDHWYRFMYDGETGAKITDNIVRLYFVDGKRGDDLYPLDGKIVDIGGPEFSESPDAGTPTSTGGTPAASSASDSGCFTGLLDFQ